MKPEVPVAGVPVELAANLWRIGNREFASNTYICGNQDSVQCVVIDPGLDTEALEEALEELGVTPNSIFCTHGHFDHIGGAAHLQRTYGVPMYLHRLDLKTLETANFTMMISRVNGRIAIPSVDVLVDDGSEIPFGLERLKFMHTPGHTPGSSFILFRGFAFSGDTLYRDSVGLNNLPGEDTAQLRQSIIEVWNRLPDSLLICPGHGGADVFGNIKNGNQKLRAFIGLPQTEAAAD
jgi:hydroxyacylglutathione hydrolase